MAEAKGNHAPIRQSVHVECPIEDAFLLFTERFAEWWPLASYSISGEQAEKFAIDPWLDGALLRLLSRNRIRRQRPPFREPFGKKQEGVFNGTLDVDALSNGCVVSFCFCHVQQSPFLRNRKTR